MDRKTGKKKRIRWIVGLTAVLSLAFVMLFAVRMRDKAQAAPGDENIYYRLYDDENVQLSDEYVMRRTTNNIRVETNNNAVVGYEWKVANSTILNPTDPDGHATPDSRSVDIEAKQIGRTTLMVDLLNASGNRITTISIAVIIQFSINEYIIPTDHVVMQRVFREEDERKSIIMDCSQTPSKNGRLELGSDATDTTKLNMNFGAANAERAEWSSTNEDVVRFVDTGSGKFLEAVGAGRATISVNYKYDTDREYSDSMTVYVRPELTVSSVTDSDVGSTNALNRNNYTNPVSMQNGQEIKALTSQTTNPLITVSNKLIWVISKEVESKRVLVRDSLGNTTPEYASQARLVYQPSTGSYKLDAKAGTYMVQFYVIGTYKNFEWHTDDTNYLGCPSVAVGGGVQVLSNFEDKTVSVNKGGTYSLSEAFNITKEALNEFFVVAIEGDGNQYVSPDLNNMILHANNLGTATIIVTPRPNLTDNDIPGVDTSTGPVTITLTVAESFMLNISETTMAVGSNLALYGIIASGSEVQNSEFSWSSTDPNARYIRITPSGRYATVDALSATPSNNPVVVTLSWTSAEGVTLTANCAITVSTTATSFHIVPDKLTMEAGQTQTIKTDLTGSYDLTWLTSDESIVTVADASADTPAAQVTAVKPGTAIITALNVANNVYTTCVVTVEQPITSLTIDKGSTFTTTLSAGFAFFTAVPQPADATETEFRWESSDPSVASVENTTDKECRITLLKEGTTYITVSSKNASAYCLLTIASKPMTSIVTDVSTLDMVVGDTYNVVTTYDPVDASETGMTWESSKTSVATVANGRITAVGVGTTTITVEAEKADDEGNKAKAQIEVNVRNKLTSIAFDSNSQYVNVGGRKTVNVIYTPDKDINKNIEFNSSDTSIFTVSKGTEDGQIVITGVKVGQAILSCVAEDLGNAKVISCIVHVTEAEVAATDFVITPAEGTVYIGQTLQMQKVFTPENATNQFVTWSVSDEKIATIDNAGVVTGVAEGTVTVSAVYTDTTDSVPWIRNSTLKVEPVPINATDFDITPSSQNIIVGDTFTITPQFTPAETTNQNVEFQSLDEGVVTVDDKGVVTGIGAGDALIQCQAEDGGFIATCSVHVDNAIKFSLDPATREIAVGKSFTLKKVTEPSNANKTAEWSTSNAAIATVSSTGKVTGKRLGSCTITARLTRYNQSAKCRVKVAKLNSKVTLDKKNIRIGVGQTYRLKKTVWSNNSKLPKVTWRTSNKRIVTVNSSGKIKGKKVGIAKVTVMTKDSIHAKATCRVRVIQRVTGLRLSSDYIVCYVGGTKKLKVTPKPKNATIKKVKWTSGDKNIAQVTGSGKVRGIAEGNTYVTVTATDGSNKKARCYVKVLEPVPATSITVAESELTLKKGDTHKLSYTVLPTNTSDSIKFASDNKRVVTVDSKGKVKAVGTGIATVTIMASGGVTSTVTINVVALNKSSINMRQYDSETLTVLGTTANVTWYSSNQRVATVTNGRVLGKSVGTTYVYAYVNGCKLGCRVTITSVNN